MEIENTSPLNLSELICFNFYSGWREIEQLFRKIVGNDMTMQKTFVLNYLFDGNRTMSEVSKHLNLDSSAVSTLVDRMFKKGLIQRLRSDEDRRIVMIGLTEDGKSLKTELDDKFALFMEVSAQGISDEDQCTIKNIVTNIKANHDKLNNKTAKAA